MASSDGMQRIARRSHKKSKTGCNTCRIRKIKCDERRPLCRNCERHYVNLVTCDFEGQRPQLKQLDHPGTSQHSSTQQTSSASTSYPLSSTPALPSTLAPARIDPFETHPPSQVPSSTLDVLIKHYLFSFAFRTFPFYASRVLIELWWPFVRDDDLLFHVTILLSSVDLTRLKADSLPEAHQLQLPHSFDALKQQQGAEAHFMMQQCLVKLSARMEDAIARVSDHTLVSVACLAALEHDRDHMRGFNTHIQGLRKIMDLRGGLQAIREKNSLAGDLVFWVIIVTSDEPSLSFINHAIDGRQVPHLHSHSGSYTDLGSYGVDNATAYILQRVQSVSEEFHIKAVHSTPEEARRLLGSACEVIANLLGLTNEATPDALVPGLSRSCRLAGCLHVFTPMSGYFPKPTMLLNAAIRDLKSSLKLTMQKTGTKSYLLLWLLAVGGITAHSMAERPWFVGYLVVVAIDLDISGWDEFRSHLVKLAFHDQFCDTKFELLWREVQNKRDELDLKF